MGWGSLLRYGQQMTAENRRWLCSRWLTGRVSTAGCTGLSLRIWSWFDSENEYQEDGIVKDVEGYEGQELATISEEPARLPGGAPSWSRLRHQ